MRLVLRSLGPSLRAGPRVSEPQEQEKAIRKPGWMFRKLGSIKLEHHAWRLVGLSR